MNWKAIAIIWIVFDILTLPLKVSPDKLVQNLQEWWRILKP